MARDWVTDSPSRLAVGVAAGSGTGRIVMPGVLLTGAPGVGATRGGGAEYPAPEGAGGGLSEPQPAKAPQRASRTPSLIRSVRSISYSPRPGWPNRYHP